VKADPSRLLRLRSLLWILGIALILDSLRRVVISNALITEFLFKFSEILAGIAICYLATRVRKSDEDSDEDQ